MEVAWETWRGDIKIQERGKRLLECIDLLNEASMELSGPEREMWVGGWVEKLRHAALAAGANPPIFNNTKPIVIDLSDDSETEMSTTRGSSMEVVVSGSTGKLPLRQSKLSFARVDRKTYLEQCAQQTLRLEAKNQALMAAEAARKEKAEEARKLKDRQRKQKARAAVVQGEIESGRRNEDGVLIKENSSIAETVDDGSIEAAREKLAQGSRARKVLQKHSGQPEPVQAPKRVCWHAPGYWVHIISAIKEEGGMRHAHKHPSSIIKQLQLTHRASGLFDRLHKGVLRRWFVENKDGSVGWKDWVSKAVERETLAGGVGQSKKLASYPSVVDGVTKQLRALRNTNIPISCNIARSIISAHLRVQAPDVGRMAFSDRWLHSFLHAQLGWSYRTATKAARKRPANWEAQCLLTFLRMTRTITRHNIKSPRLIVNANQTGVSLLPLSNKTWAQRGSSQVGSACHDERRQFTLVVGSSLGGDVIPFQSVWGGSTEASLPSNDASRRAEADALGFTFEHGDTRHWSSLDSTKKWVVDNLVPHFEEVRKAEGLPPKAQAILYIDCWPVHTSKSTPECFLPWMAANYPEISVLFVPAGCTGEFQPADTILQRVIKHVIKQAALDFFTGWSTRLLQNGAKPEDVSLPSDLPTLRNASVSWTLEAYNHLVKHPEIVKKSWQKCQTGDWNLSWEKLTSPDAIELFFSTVATNSSFRNEVSSSDPIIPCSSQEFLRDSADKMEVGHMDDPSDDVSLHVSELTEALSERLGEMVVLGPGGAFQRTGDEADIEGVDASSSPSQKGSIEGNGKWIIHEYGQLALTESTVGGHKPSNKFVTDIAVLGGTHPAALNDLTATSKLKRLAKPANTMKSRKRKRETKDASDVEEQTLTRGSQKESNTKVPRRRKNARK